MLPVAASNTYVSSKHSAGGGNEHRDGQLAEPEAEVKPGGQTVQLIAPSVEKVRAAQLVQAEMLVAPAADENLPAGQGLMSVPAVLALPTAPPPGQ